MIYWTGVGATIHHLSATAPTPSKFKYNISMYHHKTISRFKVRGTIYSDIAIPRFKDEYIRLLVVSMQERGYVMRIDINPDFTIMYNGKGYDFELSVYGVYVGKKKAQCIKYLDGHRPHMKQDRSPQSLVPQE
jgi:hypothetical protein